MIKAKAMLKKYAAPAAFVCTPMISLAIVGIISWLWVGFIVIYQVTTIYFIEQKGEEK